MQPYQTKTVYDSKTGEAITLHGVDARERIACGLATEFPKTETVVESVIDEATEQKPKRGRKPKGE